MRQRRLPLPRGATPAFPSVPKRGEGPQAPRRARLTPLLPTLLQVLLLAGGTAPTAAQGNPAAAAPRSDYQVLAGHDDAQTPDWLDRIAYVRHWSGGAGQAPPAPSAVLILIPGYLGGAEDFRYAGERLVARLPWLQVWAADRRSNFLENRAGMELAQSLNNPGPAAAYYLGGMDIPGLPPHADPHPAAWDGASREFSLSQAEAASLGMDGWGLETALGDVRALIAHARALYPNAKLYLGGHSLGGMTAQIYAAWRFGHTPHTAGWHDIDGLVLIDGGVNGPEWQSVLIGQYVRDLALIAAGQVYWDDLSIGISPFVGQLAEIAALADSLAPAAESFLWKGLPPPFAWPVAGTAPTNKALFAAFTDDDYGFSGTFRLHQGKLSGPIGITPEGRYLLHWTDFYQTSPPELSSTDVWARSLWQSRQTNGIEWYFPVRLNAEIDLASNLDSHAHFRDPRTGRNVSATGLEGQRVLDAKFVAIPVYAFAAAQGRERFDWYREISRDVPSFTLVDRSDEHTPRPSPRPYSHLDPLFAYDENGFENDFIATLTTWLADNR